VLELDRDVLDRQEAGRSYSDAMAPEKEPESAVPPSEEKSQATEAWEDPEMTTIPVTEATLNAGPTFLDTGAFS
jgi:hypothetical protein